MKPNAKLLAITTVTLIALAPTTASATSFSDGVFSWPTDYKSQKVFEAKSTFEGSIKNLSPKKTSNKKTQIKKRK